MLELVAAALLSQTPVTLQALVPTSGANAESLLDGKTDTGWVPEGDGEGEGVLFRFEGEVKVSQIFVQACPGKKAVLRPYLNAGEVAVVTVTDARTPMLSTTDLHPVRSFFLKLEDSTPTCIAEVSFAGEKPLMVRAPRRLDAVAKASSVLAPADAYHPGYLFDGRLDFGWVEGVKGPGLGESMTLTFTAPVSIAAVELWNGYQRSNDHFKKNARAKKVTLTVEGAPPFEFDVKDAQGPQKLSLQKATATKTLTLTIKEAFPGTKYDDLVLSELRVWDELGPRAIATRDLAESAAAMKAAVAPTPLARFVDHTLRSICQADGHEFEAKFRSNHSFVVYRTSDEETGFIKEVIDGTWIMKDGKSLELFGRSHRNETGYGDPYFGVTEKDSTTITGGPVTITRVSDLKKPAWDALVKKFTTGTLQWSYECEAIKDFDTLSKNDIFVLEGRAITAILTR